MSFVNRYLNNPLGGDLFENPSGVRKRSGPREFYFHVEYKPSELGITEVNRIVGRRYGAHGGYVTRDKRTATYYFVKEEAAQAAHDRASRDSRLYVLRIQRT